MKVNKNELKVFYHSRDGLNQELDKALAETLERFGYKRWASGMNNKWVRDLAFDKKE